ncbi:HAD family hydrolase [Clostridium beijerinckii]|uniref:HAD family hydrolase n=1 Tax=Clostridium beijerinckii TaxID=1520 RepID=UPI00098BF368|nr:HAD family phosphatase [Clostridium beijerinckii]MBA8935635.1 HAD superfamily hydrolase (TIGR01509 family) [Clostridium beijerinckii]NRU40029.1 HAD superfamily hydrolase (TIGR01509 family) [Clostridium beijerinckii]NSA96693.1 HAD superfamily hydrolase (TIGR01509 family) [Clostridium beijerinckii]OOM61215.1 2-deoxyglucose-6-phosphate phosphatase [Clostridium beijerinckii]OOM71737.1 2-deoxyglucose-6-phosphate phosphatase [Clostridium beijerinckii]
MKAFIFDMDGVIIDSEPIHFEVDMQTIRELGCNISEKELEKYVGSTNEYMYTDIKEKYNIKKSLQEIIDYKVELTKMKIIESHLEPIDGIKELLIELKNRNIPAAIASSSPKDLIDIVVSKFKLQEYFKYIISGEEVERGKPSPDIYIETSKKLGISPKKCVVIEDSRNGVFAAKDAKMNCIGFKNINSGNQDLSKADIIVKSIRDIDLSNILENYII